MRSLTLLATAVLTIPWALGGSPSACAAQELRAFRVTLDNDGLVFWTPPSRRPDWYYTHGTRLEATLAGRPPLLGALLGGRAGPCPEVRTAERCALTGVALGQKIFTPSSLFFEEPLPGDRPYAGWLYAAVSAASVAPSGSTELGLEVGVTGPPSLARDAHLAVHRWLDKAPPAGWDTEIPFEVGVLVSLRQRTLWTTSLGGLSSMGLEPRWRLDLGTVRTGAEAGLGWRLGWNASPGLAWAGPDRGGGYALLRLGVEGELVLRDLFLDGSTFGDSWSAERRPLLGRLDGGLEVGWGGFGVAFSAERSSRAFEMQDEPHTFATVSFVIRG